MDEYSYNVLFLLLWFILPLVPSFILFKYLPGEAWASGPFQGLKINLTGAFAAYFLLFLTAIPVINSMRNMHESYELWTVRGKFSTEDSSSIRPNSAKFFFMPPGENIADGYFRFAIYGKKTASGIEFPQIQLIVDGYKTVPLDPLDFEPMSPPNDCWKRFFAKRQAELKNPLILKKSISSMATAYVEEDPIIPQQKK